MHVIPNSEGAGIGWDPNLNASLGGRELLKKGVACSQDILKLVAWGDGTQAAAAKQGGITEVVGLDFDNTAILGFIWTKNCTVVYGRDVTEPAAPPAPVEVSAPPIEPAPAPVPPANTDPAMTEPSATAPSVAPPLTAAPPPTAPPTAPTN